MREIVLELAFQYPQMFRGREGNISKDFFSPNSEHLPSEEVGGKRKVDKEEDQARKMTDRVRKILLF